MTADQGLRETKHGVHPAAALAATLAPVLVGLAASAMLLVDYVRPSPVFCDDGGGCGAVKRTIYASILGIPTPVLGVAAFVAFGVLALQRSSRVRLALFAASAAAASFALFLIAVQAMIGRFCPFCMTTDIATLFVFVAAIVRFRAKWDPAVSLPARAFAGFAVAAALAAPLAIGFTKKAEIPDVIARALATSPEGQATVIDFVDFECPFCRMTHAELAPILESNRAHLRVIRKQVPLTRIHAHAMDAARAACCGELLGKGDAMADALFTAPVEDLTPDGCEKLASSLGLDQSAYRACVQDPKTDARIQADQNDFKAAQGKGLPTIWVDEEKIEGAQPGEELERVVRAAVARKG